MQAENKKRAPHVPTKVVNTTTLKSLTLLQIGLSVNREIKLPADNFASVAASTQTKIAIIDNDRHLLAVEIEGTLEHVKVSER